MPDIGMLLRDIYGGANDATSQREESLDDGGELRGDDGVADVRKGKTRRKAAGDGHRGHAPDGGRAATAQPWPEE